MKKYFYLQLKKVLKLFPFLLTVTVILLTVLGIVLGGVISTGQEEQKVFNIAISGDRDNNYFKIGMSALQTLDETRFSVKVIDLDEPEAEKALKNGEISAYAVLPDNFIENALSGDVRPIKYVTTAGAQDVATLFKNEVTTVITDMVVASQKGTYGLAEAMKQNGETETVNSQMTRLTIEYVNLILKRSQMIEVKELGVSNGLKLTEYYICGIFILFIMLMGLPFAPLYINRDNALSKLLVSKGYSTFSQLLSEYIANLIAFFMLLGIVFFGIGAFGSGIGLEAVLNGYGIWDFAVYAIPAVIMVAALGIALFELSSGLVSGTLLYFFVTIAFCYISGCFYPMYAFPKAIQGFASVLPIGVAFDNISSFFTGENAKANTVFVLGYALLFFMTALLLRTFKTKNYKGSGKNA